VIEVVENVSGIVDGDDEAAANDDVKDTANLVVE